MACGVCGSAGHNRRTHAEHEEPQDQALLEALARGDAALTPLGRGFLRAQLEREARASIELDRDQTHVLEGTVIVGDDHASNEGENQDTPPTSHGPDAGQSVDRDGRPVDGHQYRPGCCSVRHDDESADWSDDDAPEPSADFTVARCQECGEPLDNGESFLCDLCTSAQAAEGADRIASAFSVPGPMIGPDVDPLQPVALVRGWLPARTEVGPMDQGALITPWRTVLGPDEPIRISLSGVYELTSEEYHSFDVTGDWFSNSDAKALLASCPAQFDYDRRNAVRKISDAFDFGHVWHAVILGKGEAYQVFEPKKLDGRTKDGQAQKAEVDAARAAGITPIYGDQFKLIEAMAEAVKADPVPHALLTAPGRSEVCLFWYQQIKVTDPQNALYGQTVTVQRRAMIDHLPDMPDDPRETVRLVDGKTADHVKPDDDMRKKIYDYAYHRQAETYAAAVEALFNRDAEVTFIFQSKKPPHLITPVDLDTPAMRVAAAQNREAMEIWAECVATCEWPGYTKGVETSGVPAWIERRYEDQIGEM